MPIFEYLCEDCGSRFEKLVRRTSDEVLCPSCGKNHLEQQFSAFAAHSSRDAFSSSGPMPQCPSGMCSNPGVCGRSDN